MHRFDRILTRVENILAGTALGLATLIAITQVLLRVIFNIHLAWSEEAIVYLVIYATFLGAVITLRHNEHIAVNILEPFVGPVGIRRMQILGTFVMIVFLVLVGGYAWLLIFEPFSIATLTPTLDLPLWGVELAIPLGMSLMLVRSVEKLLRLMKGQAAFPEGEKTEYQRAEEELGLDEGEEKQ